MLACAERKVLLIDHSKLGRRALHQVCELSLFDMVVVDDGAAPEALRELDRWKVRYEVAATGRVRSNKGHSQSSVPREEEAH
jgi:DeoR/GlpR family transcriptional regulator of sugar metabolism